MGAGDSYIAGFLDGVLRGGNIEECMQEGAKIVQLLSDIKAPGNLGKKGGRVI